MLFLQTSTMVVIENFDYFECCRMYSVIVSVTVFLVIG